MIPPAFVTVFLSVEGRGCMSVGPARYCFSYIGTMSVPNIHACFSWMRKMTLKAFSKVLAYFLCSKLKDLHYIDSYVEENYLKIAATKFCC